MVSKLTNFVPIILGSDLNAYGMARDLFDHYQIKPRVIATELLAPVRYTNILDVEVIPGFNEDPGFMTKLNTVADDYDFTTQSVMLISSGDVYTDLLSKHRTELQTRFIVPVSDFKLLHQLTTKQSFYELCQQKGLPHPKTRIVDQNSLSADGQLENPFSFPVILKASDSVQWTMMNFPGKKKVFELWDQDQLNEAIQLAYANGYTSSFILQDYIPGDDSNMRVLNAYVDQTHHVKMMCLGHPLLEDPAPYAIGNYVAILPEFDQTIYDQIKTFLESIDYVGFVNFDMKYDQRDQTFKIFELNPRQGRSSFFVSLNGCNLAKLLIDDYILATLDEQPIYLANQNPDKDWLWLGIPVKVFKRYTKNSAEKQHALELIKQKRYGFTIKYSHDLSLKRRLINWWTYKNYEKDFARHYQDNPD